MKLVLAGFIYFMKVSLMLRVIFASSLEECLEDEDSSTAENFVETRTASEEYTETETSIIYNFSPYNSSIPSTRLGLPSTIIIASTFIEVITIMPSLKETKRSSTISEYETTGIKSMMNEHPSRAITSCLDCASRSYLSSEKYLVESTTLIDLASDDSTSHVTTLGASSVTTLSVRSVAPNFTDDSNTSTTKTSTFKTKKSDNCGTRECNPTFLSNYTYRAASENPSTLLSSSSLTSNISGNTDTKMSNKTTSQKPNPLKSHSSSTSDSATTYHYFDSAGQKKLLNIPIFSALLFIGYIFLT